jgi:hypothetical protein
MRWEARRKELSKHDGEKETRKRMSKEEYSQRK